MFGVSFGEILMVCLIGFLVLKPDDISVLHRQFKKMSQIISKETDIIKDSIKNINTDRNDYM